MLTVERSKVYTTSTFQLDTTLIDSSAMRLVRTQNMVIPFNPLHDELGWYDIHISRVWF